jgi:elongation factor Ts
MISSLEVKNLRELTGASMMDCKRALEASNGDIEKAKQWLKDHGLQVAEKKSARSTGAGLVEAYIHSTGRIGALVEVLCETDFVAKNPLFKELAHDLAMQVAAVDPQDLEALMSSPSIKNESETVADLINAKIALIGENIKLGKFIRFQI